MRTENVSVRVFFLLARSVQPTVMQVHLRVFIDLLSPRKILGRVWCVRQSESKSLTGSDPRGLRQALSRIQGHNEAVCKAFDVLPAGSGTLRRNASSVDACWGHYVERNHRQRRVCNPGECL